MESAVLMILLLTLYGLIVSTITSKLFQNSIISFILGFLMVYIYSGFVTYTPDWEGYEFWMESGTERELFFRIVSKQLLKAGYGYREMHLIFTGIYSFLLMFLVSRFNNNPYYISLLYISILYVFYTTQIRFFLGYYSICLAFYFFYFEKRKLVALIFVIFGLMNHYSLFLFLPFLYFFKMENKKICDRRQIYQKSKTAAITTSKMDLKIEDIMNPLRLTISGHKLYVKNIWRLNSKRFNLGESTKSRRKRKVSQTKLEIEFLSYKILYIAIIIFLVFSVLNIIFNFATSDDTRFSGYFATEKSSTLLGGIYSFLPSMISLYLFDNYIRSKLRSFPAIFKDEKFLFLYKFSIIPYIFIGIALYIQIIGFRFILPALLFQILTVLYLSKYNTKDQNILLNIAIIAFVMFNIFYMYGLPSFVFNKRFTVLDDMLNSNTILQYLKYVK